MSIEDKVAEKILEAAWPLIREGKFIGEVMDEKGISIGVVHKVGPNKFTFYGEHKGLRGAEKDFSTRHGLDEWLETNEYNLKEV